MKVISFRKDIISNTLFSKSDLVRLCVKDGKLTLDLEKKLPGRGYYFKVKSDNVVLPSDTSLRRARLKPLSIEAREELTKELEAVYGK
jgi:predicted RNA-binding protein YlxR (DUF448 family)